MNVNEYIRLNVYENNGWGFVSYASSHADAAAAAVFLLQQPAAKRIHECSATAVQCQHGHVFKQHT